MCGIVGIYNKNKDLNKKLGSMLAAMLVEMSERGPDSAGVAVYRDDNDSLNTKLTLYASQPGYDWESLQQALAQASGSAVRLECAGQSCGREQRCTVAGHPGLAGAKLS